MKLAKAANAEKNIKQVSERQYFQEKEAPQKYDNQG